MAHRLRGHRVNSTNPNTAGSTSTSGTTASSAGKRKRDVLQDISEEHGGNGSSSRQHAAAAGSSNRRSLAPRRPSPMAPARRASVRVRRSRRLSEQPASAAGRAGGRTTSVAGVGAGAGGSSGTGRGGGRGSGGDGSGGDGSGAEGDDGGMSCDEDLEGMVVDLSFDGVADDAAWRDRRQSAPPALQAATVDGDLVGSTGVVEGAREGGKSQSEALSGGSRGDTTSTAAASATSVSGNTVNSSLNVQVQTAPIAQESGRVAKTARAGNRDVGSRGGSVGGNTSTRASSDVGTGSTLSRSSSLSSVSTVEDQQMEDSFERSVTGAAASTGLKRSAAVAELEIGLARKPAAASSSDASCKASASSAAATAAEYAEKISEERMLAAAGARTPLPAGVEDIDAGVVDAAESHLQNAEYVVEHAAFLRAQERRNRPGAYIGGKQKDMRHNMRSVLVDWIVEVCDQFKLSSRTLFQVVELIDRSLTAFEVARGRLQLLGCACVVLAAKYEEIYAPTAEELAHISDNTYTRAEIIAMELTVANSLQFRLTCITPCCFVDRFCRAARSNARERSLVCYLLELLLQDYNGVVLLPSLKAAAALYLARQTLHPRGCPREAWTKQTEFYTGYSARALEPCVRRLHALHVRAEGHSLHAVRDKFKRGAMHRVAEVTCALEDALDFGED